MQEMPFQRPKFQNICGGGACPRTPLKLCRHYGLPLTKILATPLSRSINDIRSEQRVYFNICLSAYIHIQCREKLRVVYMCDYFYDLNVVLKVA